MKEAEVVSCEFVKAGEAAPEVLELVKEAFNEVTLFVKFGVIFTRLLPIGFRWDNRLRTCFGDSRADVRSVVASIS